MGNCNLHGTATIKGNGKFKIPAERFIISPLTAASDIYIDSIVTGVTKSAKIGTTDANDYTTIDGVIPFTEFHADTTETFYIKW